MVKMGRPKLPATDRRSEVVMIRMTKAERRTVTAAARAAGVTIQDFLMKAWREGKA